MTLSQLSVLLAALPDHCDRWEVVVCDGFEDRPVTGLLLVPGPYADHEYPAGCVRLFNRLAQEPADPALRVFRPDPPLIV